MEDIVSISTDTVDVVAAACRDRLGDPSAWVASDAYRASLALCIIESVQSSCGHSEVAVVDRYLAYRQARESLPVTDGARELLRTFEEAGSSDQWAGKIGSYKRRYTATGVPIEARHIQQVAERLHHLHINSVEDLLAAADSDHSLDAVRQAWTEACGDDAEVTWAHLLMLAGIPHTDLGTAADTFISTTLGTTEPLTDAAEILAATAEQLGVDSDRLDYAIRRWLSIHGRSLERAA
nr:heme peroxidase [Rhodococcus sp. MS16]